MSESGMPDEGRGMGNLARARYLSAPDAARYLGVSPNYFRQHVRPSLAVHDFGAQGRRLPRYDVHDLDAWAASRRKERKSA